ncbi:MAG: hypothetical protein AAFU77_17795 [Myxococcota bacterium]
MDASLDVTAAALALLIAYWIVDLAFHREYWSKLWRVLAVPQRASTVLLCAVALALTPVVPWEIAAEGHALRVFACVQAVMLAWKSATEDIDVATGEANWLERVLLALTAVGAWFSPMWILVQLQLITKPFIGWKHHGTLPLRTMQLGTAYVLAYPAFSAFGLGDAASSGFLLLLFMMIGSHYVITAIAKGMLGPKWYSWMVDNTLHHVVASSYTWGWARFVPERWWVRVVKGTQAIERPLLVITWVAEAAAPLVLLHPYAAFVLLATLSAFHVGVFIATGIFFWEWIITNALALWLTTVMAPMNVAPAFGWVPLVFGLALMFALPLRGKLWAPTPLGWWDTPLTQRVQWRVVGESGTTYGLHNNFMCPHERLYGRVHGCFMIDGPVFTYHLGEVWRADLRDRIRELGQAPEKIHDLRSEFGISVYEPEQIEVHVAYLKRFLRALNEGRRKFVFPKALRWLKAPGGQFYYWSEWPSYRGQEPAKSVEVWFREEYWDGDHRHELSNRKLLSFDVDADTDESCVELDEEQVDAMVLIRAQGKLVQVPEWMVAQARQIYG